MSARPPLRVRLGAEGAARLDAHAAASGHTRTEIINALVLMLPVLPPAEEVATST